MRKLLSVGCLLSATLLTTGAQASLVPTLAGITSLSDGTYLYNYNLMLTGDQGLSMAAPDPVSGTSIGSSITIYNFAGYLASSIAVSMTPGAIPAGTFIASAPSDAASNDLVFTYNGADFRTTGGGLGATSVYDNILIATLSAVSIYGSTAYTNFAGVGVKNTGADYVPGTASGTAGTVAFNSATTLAPVAQVPEAATWAMMVMGFGLVGAGLRSRKPAHAVVTFG